MCRFFKEISNLNNVKKIYNIENIALDFVKKNFFLEKVYIFRFKKLINITKRYITCFSVFQHIKNKKFLEILKISKGGYLIQPALIFYFDFFFSQRTLSIMKEKKIIPNFVNLNRIQNNSSMVNDGKKVSIFNSKIKAIDPFNLTKELESNGFRKIQIVWLKVHESSLVKKKDKIKKFSFDLKNFINSTTFLLILKKK